MVIVITPIMMKSSLRPVTWVMDSVRSTCFSSLMPSGVSSKAQAKISATGNPVNKRTVTRGTVQSGRFNIGKVVAVTSISSQVRIA